ncbi:MAG: hypothetical protein Q8R40_03555 [bacterium]|nr:hypothetical protein [bacterium]
MRQLILTILFFGGVVVLPFQAHALTISPVKIEISGDPGQILQGELTLFNEQDETKTFYSSFENFEARGETGAPFFLPERVGFATWITAQEHVTLKPKQEKIIPFSIQIPKNAQPGGHFSAILWGTTSPQAVEGGQVAVGGRLGVLILLKVSGEVKEGGGLLEFGASSSRENAGKQGKDNEKKFSSLPIHFAYRFNNTGGDRMIPQGEIKIKNIFGFTSATISANTKEGSVLPGSARKFETLWGEELQKTDSGGNPRFFEMAAKQWSEFHFGWYTAELNLVWGATNQTASATYHFFIIPWQLLLILIIILAVIGFLGIGGLKKYNRWIISKASRPPA